MKEERIRRKRRKKQQKEEEAPGAVSQPHKEKEDEEEEEKARGEISTATIRTLAPRRLSRRRNQVSQSQGIAALSNASLPPSQRQ